MIYVIGATNVDCIVKINGNSRIYESNISNVNFKLGGVGCNIARSISNFTKVEFVTVLNDFIKNIGKKEFCRENLITSNSLVTNNEEKCMYIDVIDDNGLVIGASDMSLFEHADLSFMDEIISKITDKDLVVLDANNRKVVEYVLKRSKGKKFIDAVSSVKLEKIKDLLNDIYLIKVNNFEYEFIKDIRKDNILITNGSGGTILINNEKYEFNHKVYKSINPTGCGDTFFGAFIAHFDKGIKEAVENGIVSAVACSQIEDSVPTLDDIKNIDIKSLNIKRN